MAAPRHRLSGAGRPPQPAVLHSSGKLLERRRSETRWEWGSRSVRSGSENAFVLRAYGNVSAHAGSRKALA